MNRAASRPPMITGYEHLDDLGSGGYADVYLYEQAMPKRRVAVKVLRADVADRGHAEQFTSEANLMAAVSAHPYIVTIFGAAVSDDGRPYLVMEYYPGANLYERCKAKALGVPEALRIGVQLAGAVETAHRAGILHRDLKPANVLTSAFGKPGLTDFGISAATTGAAGAEGLSVPWSPPESLDDAGHVDERSDVWSLAATVYTLLTGRSPFMVPGGDNSGLALMARIEHQPLPPTGRSDVPASLDRALAAGMAKSAAARPSSARDFARSLQAVERELRLQPTDLDIPGDEVDPTAEAPPVERRDDEDGTRFRGATVVESQPPVMPTPSRLGTAEADDLGHTRRREPPERPTDSVIGRVARDLPGESLTSVAGADPGRHSIGDSPVRPRPARMAAMAAGVVLLAAVGGGAVLLLGQPSDDASPSSAITGVGDSDDGPRVAAKPAGLRLKLSGTGDQRKAVVTWPAIRPASPRDTYTCTLYLGEGVLAKKSVEKPVEARSCTLPAPGSGAVCVQVVHEVQGIPGTSIANKGSTDAACR